MVDPDAARRQEPLYAKNLGELRDLSTEQLIGQHDALTKSGNVVVGVDYYLAELYRREAASRERTMVTLTWAIAAFTLVSMIAVIVAVFR